MSYDTMVEQIKAVPQEYLADIENYIQFILYRYNQTLNAKTATNFSKYFGSVRFNKDAREIQKEMRNEWN